MGESLDRGHVMALSLWDDVEVNMLWLDSCYPLDKTCSTPGVHRGTCPGGVESSPSYLRSNFPNSWTSFANAAIGEIGSTLQAAPTPPPTPAPSGCFPAPNMNQPECLSQSEQRCKSMMRYESKCQWITPDVPAPTQLPTSPPSSPPTPLPSVYLKPAPTPAPSPCDAFCSKQDLGSKSCGLKKQRTACEGSYRTTRVGLQECAWKRGKCRPKGKTRACKDLSSRCSPSSCRPWCEECPMPWSAKCGWQDICGSCSACEQKGFRRLRGAKLQATYV